MLLKDCALWFIVRMFTVWGLGFACGCARLRGYLWMVVLALLFASLLLLTVLVGL